ncbi:MAG: hypothetical protein QME93_10925 [Bacillota bacterium]|nr:hypothetical protein [Bacillota bacterium]MDI7250562.1 hypothetical protein [Bacillota bacterium]
MTPRADAPVRLVKERVSVEIAAADPGEGVPGPGQGVPAPGAVPCPALRRCPGRVGVEQHPATGYDQLLARLCLWARDGGVWHVRRAGSFVPGFSPTAVLVANLDGGCPELVVSGVLRADSYPGVVLTLRPEAASNGAR